MSATKIQTPAWDKLPFAERRKAWRFFREHAGYVVGEKANGAVALARAEAELRAAVERGEARVIWEDDELPVDPGEIPPEVYARSVEQHGNLWCRVERKNPQCEMCGRGPDWETVASLGSVVGDSNFRRVVEAELADEACFGPELPAGGGPNPDGSGAWNL